MAKFIFHIEWYDYCCNSMNSEQMANLIQALCEYVNGDKPSEYRRSLQSGEENIAFEFIAGQIARDREKFPEIFKDDE